MRILQRWFMPWGTCNTKTLNHRIHWWSCRRLVLSLIEGDPPAASVALEKWLAEIELSTLGIEPSVLGLWVHRSINWAMWHAPQHRLHLKRSAHSWMHNVLWSRWKHRMQASVTLLLLWQLVRRGMYPRDSHTIIAKTRPTTRAQSPKQGSPMTC